MERKSLIILIAPPASGKTYWVDSLSREVDGVMVLAPLRALADECQKKWDHRVKVFTPEEWLLKPVATPVSIFDEFHLNFYWGDTFRPKMWEAFYEIAVQSSLVVLMTATLTKEMLAELEHFNSEFDEIVVCDHGNQRLKTAPTKYLKLSSRREIEEALYFRSRNQGVALAFCPYRQDVYKLSSKLRERGLRVWSCVGGESKAFTEMMASSRELPDVIVATTVLSHGVNLPQIEEIYFLYPLKDINFWIQMVARGGRRGEAYRVYSLEKPFNLPWNFWTNFIRVCILKIHIQRMKFLQECEEWFLKESSSPKHPTKRETSSQRSCFGMVF